MKTTFKVGDRVFIDPIVSEVADRYLDRSGVVTGVTAKGKYLVAFPGRRTERLTVSGKNLYVATFNGNRYIA